MNDNWRLCFFIPLNADWQRRYPMNDATTLTILRPSEKSMIMRSANVGTRGGMRISRTCLSWANVRIELTDCFRYSFADIPNFRVFGSIYSPTGTHPFSGMVYGRKITVVTTQINYRYCICDPGIGTKQGIC